MKQWIIMLLLKYIWGYIPKGVKEMIGKIIVWLQGKKMYLAALAWAIQGVIVYLGDNDLQKLIKVLIEAWAIAAGRAAISKVSS